MPEPKTEVIRGVLRRPRFHNQNNGFAILNVEIPDNILGEDFLSTITCKGILPSVRQNEEYQFTGQWVNDPKWGMQFQFTKAEVILPKTEDGAVRYLSTIAAGIGPKKAERIVNALGGTEAIDTILNEPEKLYKLEFVTQEQAQELVTALMENTTLAELSSMICREGIGPGTAAKIYNRYGKDSIETVKGNPYVISDDVYGIGFKKADLVAKGMGVPSDSPYRVEAAYTYMLQEATNEGHVFLKPNYTIPLMKDLLGDASVEISLIAQACKALQEKGKVKREGSAIYHADLYKAEVDLARNINRLAGQTMMEWPGIEDLITAQENDMKIEYAAQQREAVATALSYPLTVLTGGPGTGKSTVTKAICNIYAEKYPHRPILLASPTGKAAKRLEEATGREAKTIHRLLMFHPAEGFRYNELEPLPGPGLLIIDEVSMMDVELANDLFKAIDEGMTVVLVGDIDQLPSVGPGCVLRDIIESGIVPTVRLQYNYRQAGGSRIAEYAHWIVSGKVPPIIEKDGDYECRRCDDPDEVQEWVRYMVGEALKQGMGPMDFQVLAPQRKGSAGVIALNELVRELANPPGADKPEYKYGKDLTYRLWDKVMIVKNDYQLGVYNGDMGIVKEIKDNGIVVDVDGWEIFFSAENMKKLTHAYAITIHKSQGSEFRLAIVVCTTQSYIMLQRNLLYTAITRAKNRLVLLTSERALKQAVKNDKQAERLSLLRERLRGE